MFNITAKMTFVGCVFAVNGVALWRMWQIKKGFDRVSDNVEVEIPESILTIAMNKAADKEAKIAANECRQMARDTINEMVKEEIAKVKGDLSKSVKENVEKQVSMLDINDIKKEVAKDVGKSVVYDLCSGLHGTRTNDAVAVINACREAGITSEWQIRNILESVSMMK